MLTESGNMSIYKQVLDYLTDSKIDWDIEDSTMSLTKLLEAIIIKDLHTNILDLVTPDFVFPRCDYVKLSATEMLRLYKSFRNPTCAEDDYLNDLELSTGCECDRPAPEHECRRLKKPEYSLNRPFSYSKIL
jgi:hypothetical protein